MRLEGWGCHFPLGMAPSPACTRGVRSSVCSWAGVDMYSRDPIADGWSHDFRWAACLGLASRFLSSIGKSGKSPAGDFYLLISKTQSLTVKPYGVPRKAYVSRGSEAAVCRVPCARTPSAGVRRASRKRAIPVTTQNLGPSFTAVSPVGPACLV